MNISFRTVTEEEEDIAEEALTAVLSLVHYDPTFIRPAMRNEENALIFSYPEFDKVRFPKMSLEIVKSSVIRYVFGVKTERKNYFNSFEGEVRSTFTKLKASPIVLISNLKPEERDEMNSLLLQNWGEVFAPFFFGEITCTPEDKKRLKKLISSFNKSSDEEFINSLELREKETIMLMEKSRLEQAGFGLPVEESFGVFLSTFVYHPSPLSIYRVMFSFISSHDIPRLYRRVSELLQGIESKSFDERKIIGIEIYLLFSKCERTRDVFFSVLVQDNLLKGKQEGINITEEDPNFDSEFLDELVELVETFNQMPTEEREEFEPIEIGEVEMKIPFTDKGSNNYLGLVFGSEFSPEEMVTTSVKKPKIYDQKSFFTDGIGCFNPSDVRYDDERTLFSVYLEKRVRFAYVGVGV